MKKATLLISTLLTASLTSGCATQTPQENIIENPNSIQKQEEAQKQAIDSLHQTKPSLKRKVALGRITNETAYGKSLLRDDNNDVLGKQVTDMLSKALTESENYLVFERPDIKRLEDEANLTGEKLNLVGVDTLLIGSLTEFGRKTVGESGFLSSTKKQIAHAKVDLRLVDSKTSHVFYSFSGIGEATTESASVAGFGSKASYDGTLNDIAISNAISDAVNKLTQELQKRPWKADILAIEDGYVYISGGKSQGIKAGMSFDIIQEGRKVKSKQTGFMIDLPGKKIAEIEVKETFGENETNEGAISIITSGNINNYSLETLSVMEEK
ncbi:CsgG/HfaB family protein [Photobacterium nomapromontoriensis]|uniref:CsgG/HfaB family protein n=1 Tax=Photobacterium nomapromontoriensis TaxID=2910237 RepID=UPI003D0B1611